MQDLRDHAHVEQVIAFGIVAARIELREQEDVLAAFHGRLERRHRFVTSDKKRDHHAGEDDDVAEGKKGVGLNHQSNPIAAGHRPFAWNMVSTVPQRNITAETLWMAHDYNRIRVNIG